MAEFAEVRSGSNSCTEINPSLPQKKFYRQRAHSNPIADHTFDYPVSPTAMDWSSYYPLPEGVQKAGDDSFKVKIVDVGCGYGGLLISLSSLFPSSTLILGLEIRVKVSDYVHDRIEALRAQNPGQYGNISVMRSNAMKYLVNLFGKGQLSKMFFLYPDPHFKKAKHKWRIITPQLLAIYAYVMEIGGLIYTITDVKDVYEWNTRHFRAHPLFEEVPDELLRDDIAYKHIFDSTEEGKKVTRNSGDKFAAVFRRIANQSL